MKLFQFFRREPLPEVFSGMTVLDVRVSKPVAGQVQLTFTFEDADGNPLPHQLFVLDEGLAFTLGRRIRKRLGLSPEELAAGARIAQWQGMDDR